MKIHGNLIDGRWHEGSAAAENRNPARPDEVIGLYAQAGAEEARVAISAAERAAPSWAASGPLERRSLLRATARELEIRSEELGRLLALEEGKTLPEAIGEVRRAAEVFEFYAGEALRVSGEILPSVRPGLEVEVTRISVGVIGVITPWNFPVAIPAWKIAPALCYGNTVVFKPADGVPGLAWALVDILHRAGLPEGVLNLVMGRGSVVGQALLESPAVHGISFTGSTATGRHVAVASAPHLRRVQLEMGGKNPLVVLDDADLDQAVEVALDGSFYSTGQRCTASSRLIVTQGIHDRFTAALRVRMAELAPGDPLDVATRIGPVANESQFHQDLDYIAIGQAEGAELTGGEAVETASGGYFLRPALFTEARNDMRICREEIFGPVAAVIQVRDYDEALAVANDTDYGLSSGICTTSLSHATHFRRNSAAGLVMVNTPTAGLDFHVPFGGRKGSSHGPREQGRQAVEFYTETRTAYIRA